MERKSLVVLMIVVVVAGAAVTALGTDPQTILGQMEDTALNPANAVQVGGFKLKAGVARVILTDGVLVPANPVAGRVVEFVFLGNGRIELEPSDGIEAGQLELFTESRSLVETFDRAVFVVALDAASDALSGGDAIVDPSAIAEAPELFEAWVGSPERRLLDIEARVFADGLGDRLAAGFFSGYFEGRRLGRFLYVVDPLAQEQVTLGQFVQPELSRRDEKRAQRSIRQAQRKGKLIGLEVADLGTWDTWVSTSLRDSSGQPAPGTRGVEPEHYQIEATLSGRDLDLEATARIDMRVVVNGLRSIALEMHPDLQPVRVFDGNGGELPWLRSRTELVAVLPQPANSGDRVSITVGYTGRPIEKIAGGAFVQRATTGWYPHAGTIDRATYDVTIHRPEKFDLVAPGIRDFGGVSKRGLTAGRWRLDRPSLGFSFELGRYEFATGWAGDVEVSVAADRLGHEADDGLAEEILATTIDVLEYYSEVFGPYPLRRLQVVSSPRGFSQGLLGFVSLSTAAVVDWDVWGEMLGTEDPRTVIAHEVAHQWWGNAVGWRSYRDQWISEAMATYSALLYARIRLTDDRDARTRRGPTADWESALIRATVGGRRLESLGPVVLGARLDSSITDRAYSAIVYKKGALALNMLSRFYGEEGFLEVLRAVIDASSFRVISTGEFLAMIQQLGGTDLTWFRRQYVEGTGMPVFRFTYDVSELPSGRWVVEGEARMVPLRDEAFQVFEISGGVLDVRRADRAWIDPDGVRVVVPIQIGFTDTTDESSSRRRIYTGQLLLSGEVSPFRLELDVEPEIFFVDRDTEVFGRFYNQPRWPKRNRFHQGRELTALGDEDAALVAYREALAEPVTDIPENWRDALRSVDDKEEGNNFDARIHLEASRLHLNAERLTEASREFDLARDLFEKGKWRSLADDVVAVESRIDLQSGDSLAAFKRLKKGALGSRKINGAETWALLAVAAHRIGESEVFAEARDRAADLGVDLGPLPGD